MRTASLLLETLKPEDQVRVTLRGNSMVPLLRDGDMLIVARGLPLRKGAVVAYEMDGNLIAHRIVAIGSAIQTKGDAVNRTDSVAVDRILGVVIGFIRNGRQKSLESFGGRAYAALLPFSSLALRALLKLTQKKD
ncbi:MAG TPA: S24/S26 family peptidase [Acidobacteriota bacterium]|nr:S24/S26 family peptidase [Acidobacteriota bacterium]